MITEVLKNLIGDNFKNTALGFRRIRRNLGIENYSNIETEAYLREIIQSTPLEHIYVKGKNYYFHNEESNVVLTVNKSSLTIITAKFTA